MRSTFGFSAGYLSTGSVGIVGCVCSGYTMDVLSIFETLGYAGGAAFSGGEVESGY